MHGEPWVWASWVMEEKAAPGGALGMQWQERGKRGVMRPSPSQVSSSQSSVHAENDGPGPSVWGVEQTLWMPRIAPRHLHSAHSYTSLSLLFCLRAFAEAVGASHQQRSSCSLQPPPATERQEPVINALPLTEYLQPRSPLCLSMLVLPPSLPQSPHSLTPVSWDQILNTCLYTQSLTETLIPRGPRPRQRWVSLMGVDQEMLREHISLLNK